VKRRSKNENKREHEVQLPDATELHSLRDAFDLAVRLRYGDQSDQLLADFDPHGAGPDDGFAMVESVPLFMLSNLLSGVGGGDPEGITDDLRNWCAVLQLYISVYDRVIAVLDAREVAAGNSAPHRFKYPDAVGLARRRLYLQRQLNMAGFDETGSVLNKAECAEGLRGPRSAT
jgi:hypothetical protein